MAQTGAFGIQRLEQLTNAIRHFRNIARHNMRLAVTGEQLLQTFVHAEDRFAVTRAAELAKIPETAIFGTHIGLSDGTKIYMTFNPHDKPVFIVPDYIDKKTDPFTADADPEFVADLKKFVELWADMERGYSLMYHMLQTLHRVCSSPEQVRFYFPGTLALLGAADDTDEGAKTMLAKLRDPKVPRSIPRIEPALRDFCRISSRRLALAKMLSGDGTRPAVEVNAFHPEMPSTPWNPGTYLAALA